MSPKSYDPRPLFYQLNWRERITAWVLVVIFFIVFALYALEMPRFGNTFDVKSLMVRALIVFGIIGAAIGAWMTKPEKDLTERVKLFLFIFLSALFFAPLFANVTNRWFSSKTEIKSYEIFEAIPIGAPHKNNETQWSTRDYYIFVFEDDKFEQIRLKDLTEAPSKGQQIELEIGEGLFGWKFLN